MEDRISLLVEQWTLEEIFDMMDISPEQVISILIEGGHVELPPFLEGFDV